MSFDFAVSSASELGIWDPPEQKCLKMESSSSAGFILGTCGLESFLLCGFKPGQGRLITCCPGTHNKALVIDGILLCVPSCPSGCNQVAWMFKRWLLLPFLAVGRRVF